MEEFDLDIIYDSRRQHGNVNGLTRAYEGVDRLHTKVEITR
jgi:hypothetical protein